MKSLITKHGKIILSCLALIIGAILIFYDFYSHGASPEKNIYYRGNINKTNQDIQSTSVYTFIAMFADDIDMQRKYTAWPLKIQRYVEVDGDISISESTIGESLYTFPIIPPEEFRNSHRLIMRIIEISECEAVLKLRNEGSYLVLYHFSRNGGFWQLMVIKDQSID